MSTRVFGVDLSLTATGVAHPDTTESPAHTEVIKKPSSQIEANGWPELRRLRWMRDRVVTEVRCASQDGPVLVVIEGLAVSRTTGRHLTRAGLWWMVVDALDALSGVHWAQVAPTGRAKYASGKGNAGKDVVMREVARRFPDFDGGEDEADALVLRAMGMDWLGQPLAPMPQTHRAALDAVQWPGPLVVDAATVPPSTQEGAIA